MAQVARLWEKGEKVKTEILDFTVGSDPEIDEVLVVWDTVGSAAHAKMLFKIGLLTKQECKSLLSGLSEINQAAKSGGFKIKKELEDVHTAIETELVRTLGETGKKIHTGRSRNDQVITALRLYMRDSILKLLVQVHDCCTSFVSRVEQEGEIPMPGYTHLRPAMPSSIAVWLHAFIEGGLSCIKDGLYLYDQLDENPLGAGAGYGSSLDLDREYTAQLLGFSKVQRSVVDVQNSRGRHELKFLRWLNDTACIFDKFINDLILYSTDEFGFISLPNEFTTGSSIMPQKRNPDVLELMRGKVAKLFAAEQELKYLTSKLPSNYHRDYQGTKEPLVKAIDESQKMLSILKLITDSFKIDSSKLKKAMKPELYATYQAFRFVREGEAFRDAYRKTARLTSSDKIDPDMLEQDFSVLDSQTKKDICEAKRELDLYLEKVSDVIAASEQIYFNSFDLIQLEN